MGLIARIKETLFSSFKSKKEKKNEEEENYDEMLCRFVLNGAGDTVGESIAVDDENVMIIKSEEKYLGVPLKHIEKQGKTLLVKGLVDYDKAMDMGEQWRKNSYQEIKHLEEK